MAKNVLQILRQKPRCHPRIKTSIAAENMTVRIGAQSEKARNRPGTGPEWWLVVNKMEGVEFHYLKPDITK
jgi:hypothetical protein